MRLAREGRMSGHFSHRKTAGKVYKTLFWPGIGADIERFCKACEACQRFTYKGRVMPVPLSHMPLVSEPFSKIAIDIVGPISPKSGRGHRYILKRRLCHTTEEDRHGHHRGKSSQ